VVFHNSVRLQLTQVEIVSLAGMLFAIYLCLMAAVAGGCLLFAGRRAFHWLWPRDNAQGTYWQLAALNLALMVAVLVESR